MPFITEGTNEFQSRISRYNRFSSHTLEISKKFRKAQPEVIKKEESSIIFKHLESSDFLILLDEGGKEFGSRAFAGWLEKQLSFSHKRIVFLIGGAFGFSEEIYQRSNFKLSLSKMTYSHQLIRIIFTEQLYRAFSIIKNEKYHND